VRHQNAAGFVLAVILTTLACSILQAQEVTAPTDRGGEPAAAGSEEPATRNEEAHPPSSWAARKYGVAVGYSGSTVEVDVPRNGSGQVVFKGWGVTGRVGLSRRWGIQFGYRNMDDDEDLDSGEKLSLDLFVAHSYYVWLETKHTQWHVKFGVTWADFESEVAPGVTFSDQVLGPSIGTGFQWGSPRYALFVDFGFTLVDVELIPETKESFIVGNTLAGFIYRF